MRDSITKYALIFCPTILALYDCDLIASPMALKAKVRVDSLQTSELTKAGDKSEESKRKSKIDLNTAEFKISNPLSHGNLELTYFAHSNTLDTAIITHRLNDTLSIVAGKMYLMVQSWEYDYAPSDQYFYSLAGSVSPSQAANGLQLNLTFSDHTISFQTLQGERSIQTMNDNQVSFEDKGGLSSAIQYRGSFHGTIKPLLTYSMIRTSASKGSDGHNYGNGYQRHAGFGLQILMGNTQLEAEWSDIKTFKFKNETAPSNKDTDIQSIVLHAKMTTAYVTPFLKVSSDQMKTGMSQTEIDSGAKGDLTGLQYAVGLEHMLDATCRLHLFHRVNSTSEKIAANKSKKISSNETNFGITASM